MILLFAGFLLACVIFGPTNYDYRSKKYLEFNHEDIEERKHELAEWNNPSEKGQKRLPSKVL